LAQEKFTGFFKGNMANVYRSFGSSMVLVLYDELKKAYLEKLSITRNFYLIEAICTK